MRNLVGQSIRTRHLSDRESAWLYANHPEVGFSPEDYCPTCEKRGTYVWKGQKRECDCELQLQLLKHYLVAGIGATYQRLDWDDVADDSLVRQVGEYGLNHEYLRRGIGLFLVGDVGTGKTMVGTLCLKDFVKAGYRCFAITFAQMIDMYTSTWRSAEERNRFDKKVIGSQVLLLDDIGKEHRLKNNLPEATFDMVLRSRVQAGRSTIVTTNLRPDDVREGYGAAALSLLREKSISIDVAGSDFRRQANARELDEVRRGETRPLT
ncbi:DnaC-like helicase loader [Gordonia phage Pupper]|uniref:DnaC-like helicase loader n=1 Tax=Gordonia phage Pupper TaxID=2571249 RepID=A0A4Y6EJH8_9CAUD|nr:DnaC-like helicase loader [Gordonia phage Pupper]QDF18632.1 DnaC-like helicase loader [Gordonia phage Pupper]